jgi:hypothetical protein
MQQQRDGQPARVPHADVIQARGQWAVDYRRSNQRLQDQEVIPAGRVQQSKKNSIPLKNNTMQDNI